jgi:hypothetical protein
MLPGNSSIFIQIITQVLISLDRSETIYELTYPFPVQPSRLSMSLWSSPSNNDLRSFEKDSGSSTFWNHMRKKQNYVGHPVNSIFQVSWLKVFSDLVTDNLNFMQLWFGSVQWSISLSSHKTLSRNFTVPLLVSSSFTECLLINCYFEAWHHFMGVPEYLSYMQYFQYTWYNYLFTTTVIPSFLGVALTETNVVTLFLSVIPNHLNQTKHFTVWVMNG